ncbi:uncharacterized protein KY384_004572 [Bacidia gigantensis]|uniref:uncharacterized protein n=1 Tax=Bacidia gigantensis TaxID=2732470 RepID=UPI001D038E37|nr:uncharacterized protein KY384_004572 [Bacidia gigantensis]KAG8531214.1 hypothetical protein KY384_004572 [Bacidia gigantensis]
MLKQICPTILISKTPKPSRSTLAEMSTATMTSNRTTTNNHPRIITTQRALILSKPLSPPPYTLRIHHDSHIPTPEPTKGDHLIKVHSTALCARELTWPAAFPDAIFSENPSKTVVPGYDLAGTVLTTEPASPFNIGDKIYCRTLPNRPGNCRAYTIARTNEMALMPRNLSWEDAATVPLSALTAWQCLFDKAGFKPGFGTLGNDAGEDPKGKKVLVTAAAGGVGVWLIQLARMAGMEVVAQIGSQKNAEFVKRLGATKTVNYREETLKQWAEREGQVDLVIDSVGGKTLEQEWWAVREGGRIVGIFEPPEGRRPEELKEKNVKNEFFIMRPEGKQLQEITKLVEQGRVETVKDSVWDFDEWEKAFERSDGGHTKGKVVIRVAK